MRRGRRSGEHISIPHSPIEAALGRDLRPGVFAFQFHTVRLRPLLDGLTPSWEYQFQFHTVRLRHWLWKVAVPDYIYFNSTQSD